MEGDVCDHPVAYQYLCVAAPPTEAEPHSAPQLSLTGNRGVSTTTNPLLLQLFMFFHQNVPYFQFLF